MNIRRLIGKWFRINIHGVINSIALIPALIAIGFLFLSWSMIELDASAFGKNFKGGLSWLRLKDANTARTIVSTITSGIISLTVFSFSLVMIVLTQAASQLSNRTLASMIENRFQQFVLGFYIGSIVYSLFLLASIRDIDTGIYVPAISIYLLILFTIFDIFLFIYFLNYVTHTVKYETVIRRLEIHAIQSIYKNFQLINDVKVETLNPVVDILYAPRSGYFQGFAEKELIETAVKAKFKIHFTERIGTYLVKGTKLATIHGIDKLALNSLDEIWELIDFYDGQPINRNPDYGFNQLAEVALKALSPGINDPATAVLSLHALSNLFALRLNYQKNSIYKNEVDEPVVFLEVNKFQDQFIHCIFPIWNYGKNDQYIQDAIISMVEQLISLNQASELSFFLQDVLGTAKSYRMQATKNYL